MEKKVDPEIEKLIASNEPYMAFPIIAFLLAITAGSMDGYTYFIGKAFSTVQSGNIILLGQTIATGNWSHFSTVFITVIAFGLGAALTALVQKNKKNGWSFSVLLIEIVVLFFLTLNTVVQNLASIHICMIISFLAGMQGNAFHKFGKQLVYGNVAVTLVVQNAFSFLMKSFYKESGALKKSLLYFSVLLGFSLGGFVGTKLAIHNSNKALWLPIIILIIVYGVGKYLDRKTKDELSIDPAS